MQYVASHTKIPIPKLYAVHTEPNGCIYIEMAYVKGDNLETAWKRASTDEKNSIFADIKQHLSCLRELQPPTQDTVCSALQNPAYDCRIGARFFGPMNHKEFHSLTRASGLQPFAAWLDARAGRHIKDPWPLALS